ncbi:hypothetical protein HPB47_020483 [Ixodes persulcatus]|uniref:Uncharacterized protein n=1 Tax=Ixodes persulcatus TaxID=34615 RepID=A0AC60QF79_IXOPE|nr:hypothetical protein HPB47_020483 [Ixodes persulcatus]
MLLRQHRVKKIKPWPGNSTNRVVGRRIHKAAVSAGGPKGEGSPEFSWPGSEPKTPSSPLSSQSIALLIGPRPPLFIANLRGVPRRDARFLQAVAELRRQLFLLADSVQRLNSTLLTLLRQRDRLLTRRGHHYDLITAVLQAVSPKRHALAASRQSAGLRIPTCPRHAGDGPGLVGTRFRSVEIRKKFAEGSILNTLKGPNRGITAKLNDDVMSFSSRCWLNGVHVITVTRMRSFALPCALIGLFLRSPSPLSSSPLPPLPRAIPVHAMRSDLPPSRVRLVLYLAPTNVTRPRGST